MVLVLPQRHAKKYTEIHEADLQMCELANMQISEWKKLWYWFYHKDTQRNTQDTQSKLSNVPICGYADLQSKSSKGESLITN